MPRIRPSFLSSTNQAADQALYTTTGTIVLAPSRLHLWVILSSRAGADPSIPTVSGRSVPWDLVGSVLVTAAGATRRRLSVFRGVTAADHDASTDGMTTTIDFGGETQSTLMGALIPLEHAAISRNGADAIVALASGASAADADGFVSVALPAQKHSQHGILACWGSSSATAAWARPGADYIETAGSQSAEGLAYHVGWSSYNTPVADIHATAGLDLAVLALEVRPALYESLASPSPRTFVETEWDLDPGATGAEKWRRNTHLVKGFRIRRGRRTSLDRIEAATLSCVMDGSDRRFETGYAGELWNYAKNPTGGAAATTHWAAVAGATLAAAGGVDNPAGTSTAFIVNDAGGGTAGQGIQYDEGAGRVPVTASTLYTFSVNQRSVDQQNNVSFKLQVEEYNSGGASIRVTETSWTLLTADSQTWRRPSVTLTTLATTATVIVRVLATTAHSSYYVANLQIEKGPLTDYIDGDLDNGRWEGAADLSRSYRGGPYYPNVRPMRRIRVMAAYDNAVEDSSLETAPISQATDPGPTGPDGSPWWHDSDSGGVVSRVTAPTPVAGTYVYKAEKTAAGNASRVRATQRWAIPVEPGDSFRVSAHFQRDAASPAGTYSAAIAGVFYDRSWVEFGGVSLPTVEPPTGKWIRARSDVLTAPPAAAWFVPHIQFFNAAAPVGTIVYADAVQVDLLPSSSSSSPILPYRQGYGTFRLFTGYILRLPQETLSYRRGQVTLECVDGFAVLAKDEFVGSPPSEGSAARITRMLDSAGWPSALRKLDAGTQTLAALTNVAFSHLAHLLDVAYTEIGAFFIDGSGRAVFHDRNHRTTDPRSTTGRFTFGDAAGELPYLPTILPEQDVARVRNEIKATRPGGVQQTATDATSISRYFTRTLSAETLHSTDAAALTWAQTVLANLKEPPLEVERLDLDPARDPLLWAATLALEISDRVTVNRRPQGLALVQFVSFVEAIEISAELTERLRWRVSLALSPAP